MIKVTGLKSNQNRMKRLIKNMDFDKMAIANIAQRNVLEHFDEEMGKDGAWEKSKRAKREGGKTLSDQGDLRKNIYPKVEGNNSVVIADRVYAAIHNFGGFAGRGRKAKIPKREFMYLDDKGEKRITDFIKKNITKGVE